MVRAVHLAWVGDDVFISLRYAQQFLDGHGLVFNPGERVEGYTNFLWTMILAGGMRLGMDPVRLSSWLGILSYGAIAAAFLILSYRLREDSPQRDLLLPFTTVAVLLQPDFQIWATSGLETAWTTMLVACGFVTVVLAERLRAFAMAGLAFTLAAMSRPDALLFYAMTIPYLLVVGPPRWKRIPAIVSPLVLLYVPYWLWRYDYYGYPFPNTYYAKSADLAWYSQGFEYLWLYVKTYYVFLLVPFGLGWIAIRALRRWPRRREPVGPVERAGVLALLFVVPYVWFVVRTGGDFMFARFWIPVTPFLFFVLEYALRTLRVGDVTRAGATVLLLLMVVARWNQFPGGKELHRGIADEREHYTADDVERSRRDGLLLRDIFADTEETVAFWGGHAVLVYYARPDVAIEAHAGLTDEFLAHRTLTERGRPGHEKEAPMRYLASRGVNFLFKGSAGEPSPYDERRLIRFGELQSVILVYDNDLMNELREDPRVEFQAVPELLDSYLPVLARADPRLVRQEYAFFKAYYFDHNDDPDRQRAFEAALR